MEICLDKLILVSLFFTNSKNERKTISEIILKKPFEVSIIFISNIKKIKRKMKIILLLTQYNRIEVSYNIQGILHEKIL